MKVLHISTYDRGGAAIAAIRLHLGLLQLGIDSNILFLMNSGESIPKSYYFPKISIYRRIMYKLRLGKPVTVRNQEKIAGWKTEYEGFSLERTDYCIHKHPLFKEADIINLHWVAKFLDYPSFFKHIDNKKLVWTLHDMNAFTGGCHYAWDCNGFQRYCDGCPQLEKNLDVTEVTLLSKMNSLAKVSLKIVSPSLWLFNQSQKSSLFKHYDHTIIPYGIDSNVFKVNNTNYLREKYNIAPDKKIILFVSQMINNKRKGIKYLYQAIDSLEYKNDVVLCIVGDKADAEFDIDCLNLGTVKDDYLMAQFYASSDLFVIPSLQDNLPNTVLESLMCGTPVVGFPVGGIADMVEDGKNGFLCKSVSSKALKEAIERFFKNEIDLSRENIRKGAMEKYSLAKQAKAYVELYQNIILK